MCVNTYNDVLDDSKCSQQEKLTVQRCSDFLCPQWKTGDWSEVGAVSPRWAQTEGMVHAKSHLCPCSSMVFCCAPGHSGILPPAEGLPKPEHRET